MQADPDERPLDYRLDLLLQGISPGVFKRIQAAVSRCEVLDDNAAASGRLASADGLTREQIFAMSNAWQIACATGFATIGGGDQYVRTCATSIQHWVESWLTERLRGPGPFTVVAAIHTPAPASPLRHWTDAAVPATLLAPHLRDDVGVQAALLRRAGSVRGLLDAGATLHACYSAASLDTMSLAEREVYRSTCETYSHNLIDAPSPLSPGAFRPVCGATYLFGKSSLALTGCFAVRLPQAADAAQGHAGAEIIVASPLDAIFKHVLGELSRTLGLELDPARGGVAARAMVDEIEYC